MHAVSSKKCYRLPRLQHECRYNDDILQVYKCVCWNLPAHKRTYNDCRPMSDRQNRTWCKYLWHFWLTNTYTHILHPHILASSKMFQKISLLFSARQNLNIYPVVSIKWRHYRHLMDQTEGTAYCYLIIKTKISATPCLKQKWLIDDVEHTCKFRRRFSFFNPLKPELNPICYLLALLGAHHFLHVSRIRVKLLTLRWLMFYIYGAPILDVSRSHTTTQHSR